MAYQGRFRSLGSLVFSRRRFYSYSAIQLIVFIGSEPLMLWCFGDLPPAIAFTKQESA